MIDKEKVVERLEYCAETRDGYVRDCINDALELLKSQPQIVRCKDCRNSTQEMRFDISKGERKTCTFCTMEMRFRDDDFFCRDGKPKGGDGDA